MFWVWAVGYWGRLLAKIRKPVCLIGRGREEFFMRCLQWTPDFSNFDNSNHKSFLFPQSGSVILIYPRYFDFPDFPNQFCFPGSLEVWKIGIPLEFINLLLKCRVQPDSDEFWPDSYVRNYCIGY